MFAAPLAFVLGGSKSVTHLIPETLSSKKDGQSASSRRTGTKATLAKDHEFAVANRQYRLKTELCNDANGRSTLERHLKPLKHAAVYVVLFSPSIREE